MQKKLESVVADAEIEVGEIKSSLCRARKALEACKSYLDWNRKSPSDFNEPSLRGIIDRAISPSPCAHAEEAEQWKYKYGLKAQEADRLHQHDCASAINEVREERDRLREAGKQLLYQMSIDGEVQAAAKQLHGLIECRPGKEGG